MTKLIEGQPVYVQGSGKKPYELKNTGGVYSCTCPAWRNQGVPIDKRTCKHLRKLLGNAAEEARIGNVTVSAPVQTASDEEAQVIHDRAAAEGRKLRTDEKVKLNGPKILLAHSWDGVVDPTGYYMSEKLDGVRAYWNGKDFISRQGNIFHAPDWFKAGLPNTILDGELWLDRKKFSETISVVKSHDSGKEWQKIRYNVFDAPKHPGPFEERLVYCHSTLHPAIYARVLEQEVCTGVKHLRKKLMQVELDGGEGLMLRQAGSLYEEGRSHTLLKVKTFFDIEAEVVGYTAGKGRLKGITGALECKFPNGVPFSVGTGLSDELRRNPPKVGAQVTVRYQEISKEGVPRFPVFIAERNYE